MVSNIISYLTVIMVTSVITVAILFGQAPNGGDQGDQGNKVKGHRACPVAKIRVAACRTDLDAGLFNTVGVDAKWCTRSRDDDGVFTFNVTFL